MRPDKPPNRRKTLNRLIPAILSIALLAPPIFALDKTPSPSQYANEYGIEPDRSYPGTMVIDLLRAAEDAAAAGAKEAFEFGYKDGRVDGEALWKPRYADAIARAVKAEKRPTVKDVLFGTAVGILVGVGASVAYEQLAR